MFFCGGISRFGAVWRMPMRYKKENFELANIGHSSPAEVDRI